MEALYVLGPGGFGLPPFISGHELPYDLDDTDVGREGRLTNGVYLAHDQRLLMRAELLAADDGRRAIVAWESGDHTLAQEYEDRRQVHSTTRTSTNTRPPATPSRRSSPPSGIRRRGATNTR